MLNQMRIAVGVLTYNNNSEEVSHFVSSLETAKKILAETYPSVEVILLYSDNGHPSVYKKFAIAHEVPSVGNHGFGHGMNRMMKHAFDNERAAAFIACNPDGSFHPESLVGFIKNFQKHGPWAILEALQFPEENAKFYNPKTFITSWCSGCCFLLSREAFFATGGFDQSFFMYMEDVDLSWRARALGFRIFTCPDVLYEHSVMNRPPSTSTTKYILESTRYFGWKWRSDLHFRECSSALIEAGFYSAETLPNLKKLPKISWIKSKKVADYSHPWAYAKLRWFNEFS